MSSTDCCFTVGKNNDKLNPGKLFTAVPSLCKAGVCVLFDGM